VDTFFPLGKYACKTYICRALFAKLYAHRCSRKSTT